LVDAVNGLEEKCTEKWNENVRKMYGKCTENWTEMDEIWTLFSMKFHHGKIALKIYLNYFKNVTDFLKKCT